MLSTINWLNDGAVPGRMDPDRFNATFGAEAGNARAIVRQAIRAWEEVIVDFNYTHVGEMNYALQANTFGLSVQATNLPGNSIDGNPLGYMDPFELVVDRSLNDKTALSIEKIGKVGKPILAVIYVDDDAAGHGWYFDPTPSNHSEFTELVTPFRARGNLGGSADFYSTVLRLIGKAVGITTEAVQTEFFRASRMRGMDPVSPKRQLHVASYYDPATKEFPGVIFTQRAEQGLYSGPRTNQFFTDEHVIADDLMTATPPVDTRDLISDLDVGLLAAGYIDDPFEYTPSYSLRYPSDIGRTFPAGSIRGRIYTDDNQNRKLDAGEAGIAGRLVFADLNNSGSPDAFEPRTSTRQDGTYELRLPPGNYTIREILPPGWLQTSPFSLDTPAAYTSVIVRNNETREGWDFGTYWLGTVSGTVYNDTNVNGIFDITESALAGRTIYADINNNGMLDTGETSALTNANGGYRLILPDGSYRIRQVLPATWFETTPFQFVAVTQQQPATNRNFGSTRPGSLSGRVYYDRAADGISNDSDPGLNGFVVFLDSNFSGTLDSGEPRTTSDVQGAYKFDPLYPTFYSVRLVLPASWEQVSPTPASGQSQGPFNTRVFGGFDSGYTDFGIIQAAYVSGKVFDDRNGDGIRATTGEPGLGQWWVFADINGNGLSDIGEPGVYTDATGNYRLQSPQSGAFQVKVIRNSGWQSTVPASGARVVSLVFGSDVSNQDFGLTQGPLSNAGFRPPLNFPSGTGDFSNPISVATGDFNGDGKLDFVSANNSSDLTVYLNNGSGGFTSASAGFAGASMRRVRVVDLNGDGKLDLITANRDSSDVSALLGNGNGTFGLHVDYPAALLANDVVAADFNNDQKLDLAVAGSSSDQIALLLGNGDGTFAAAKNVANVFGSVSLAVGDLNRDARMDLVSANDGAGNVSVLLGNGDGTFQPPSLINAEIVNPVSLALADLNADGLLDLAVVNMFSDNVYVALGNGNGSLKPGTSFAVGSVPTHVAVGDIDGDGRPDLVVANQSDGTTDISGGISVLRNRGNGTFDSPLTSTSHTSPISVAVGDFNGDALLDLVAANFHSDDVSVMINQRGSATGVISGLVFEDHNGDGVNDPGENGLAGRLVFVDANNDGQQSGSELNATTDANGQFYLPPLGPGAYVVRQIVRTGWEQTRPAANAGQTVNLAGGQNLNVVFGQRDKRPLQLVNTALVTEDGQAALRFVFDKDLLGNSLAASDLQLTNLTTGQLISRISLTLSMEGAHATASFTLPDLTAGVLPDGDYHAVLPAGAVTDASENTLATDVSVDFFVLGGTANPGQVFFQDRANVIDAVFAAIRAGASPPAFDLNKDGFVNQSDVDTLVRDVFQSTLGDANLDGGVDFADFLRLSANFGRTDAGWRDGDFTADGRVTFADFLILAAGFGKKPRSLSSGA